MPLPELLLFLNRRSDFDYAGAMELLKLRIMFLGEHSTYRDRNSGPGYERVDDTMASARRLNTRKNGQSPESFQPWPTLA
jgi:hypothetical protein